MARIPYYNDPVFLASLNRLGTPGPGISSPFSATQAAVAGRLQQNRTVTTGLGLQTAAANAGYNNGVFMNDLAYKGYQGNVNRGGQRLSAEQALNYQAKLEERKLSAAKKQRRRGIVGAGLGLVAGGAAGLMSGGNPFAIQAGFQGGQTAGSLFY